MIVGLYAAILLGGRLRGGCVIVDGDDVAGAVAMVGMGMGEVASAGATCLLLAVIVYGHVG